jgi:hypothetical protein
MNRRWLRHLAAACVPLLLGGCFATYTVPLSELGHLDGYDIHDEHDVPVQHCSRSGCSTDLEPESDHTLLTANGPAVPYTSDTPMVLVGQNGERVGSSTVGAIASLHVRGANVSGLLVNGSPYSLPDVDHAEVTVPNTAETMIVGAVALAAVTFGGYELMHAEYESHCHDNCSNTNAWGAAHGIPPLPCSC